MSDTVKINLDLSQPKAEVTALGKVIKDSMGAKNIGKEISDSLKTSFGGLKQELEKLSKISIGTDAKPEEIQAYVTKYKEAFGIQQKIVNSVKEEVAQKLKLANSSSEAVKKHMEDLNRNKTSLQVAEERLKVQNDIIKSIGKTKEGLQNEINAAKASLAKAEETLSRRKTPETQASALITVEKRKKTLEDLNKLQDKHNQALSLQETIDKRIQVLKTNMATDEQALVNIKTKTSIKSFEDIANMEKELKLQKENLMTLERKSKAILNANAAQKQAVTVVEQLGERMKRLVEYTVMAFAVSKMKQYFTEGLRFIEQLDKSLTEIATVTGKTRAEMWKMADEFNRMGRELGLTTNAVAEASVLFYRQGLNSNQVLQMVRASTISAAIANTEASVASDRLTAALRGYNMEADQAMSIADKLAALAARSASSFDELSYAIKLVA